MLYALGPGSVVAAFRGAHVDTKRSRSQPPDTIYPFSAALERLSGGVGRLARGFTLNVG